MEDPFVYHKCLDFYERNSFAEGYDKLRLYSSNFSSLIDEAIKNQGKGVVTALVFNLLTWLLSHLAKSSLLYASKFEREIFPILASFIEEDQIDTRTFGNRFYPAAKKVVDQIKKTEDKKRKIEGRLALDLRSDNGISRRFSGYDYNRRLKRAYEGQPETDIVQGKEAEVINAVENLDFQDICDIAMKSKIADRKRFMTTFCFKLLGQFGVTYDDISRTYVYNTHVGDRHLFKKKVIKSVMTKLRLRICKEAIDSGVVVIGEKLPFLRKNRKLIRITSTGMFVIMQKDGGNGRTTHVSPVFFPLLQAIKDAKNID